MGNYISPGVYSKIIDLSNYVSEVPGTVAMIAALTKKGEDNTLKMVSSRSDLISEFGQPNILDYGKNYGQGLYAAYNYLGESGSLYFMRCLPDDAAYANLLMSISLATIDSTADVILSYIDSDDANTLAELQSQLTTVGTSYPLGIFYPIGRGEYYNAISVRLVEHSNPMINGVYVLEIYERQSDGTEVVIETFDVSFDPNAIDTAGDSLWISYVLATYSKILRFVMLKTDNETYAEGYDYAARVYDKDIGANVDVELTAGSATIYDDKQNFDDWKTISGTEYDYMVVAKDNRGNKIWGWLGNVDSAKTTIDVYNTRFLATGVQEWLGDTADFSTTGGEITYEVRKTNTDISSAFISATPVPLRNGIDGAIVDSSGTFVPAEGKQILANAYAGTIDEDVIDSENLYFSVVFDCGYPSDVKTQISTLVQTRKDCVAILDNGDNSSSTNAIATRNATNTFNNYYCALYECYNKVYDIFTGQDIWVSPTYHMSYLLPRNDRVAEIWYAVAGFNRATIDSIKELRYNPKLAERDQLYLRQLNPIVKFLQGYAVYGQLTSQTKASAMQDLNIVRLVLYIQKALTQFCQYYIFEMNDALTWSLVSGQIVEFLDSIQKKRGLYSFSVEVGATPYEIKKKTFHVNVTLNPTRVVEKIELVFTVV